jgi:hypothetical protein
MSDHSVDWVGCSVSNFAGAANGLFRNLLTLLDTAYPASEVTRIYVVVDNYRIHKAKAVTQWLAPPVLKCLGALRDQPHRGKTEKSICRLDG